MGRALKAIITVRLADHDKVARRDWLGELGQEDAVSQVYSVSGETDDVIVLNLNDMDEFKRLSERLFSNNKNVTQYTTLFDLEQHKWELLVRPTLILRY